VSTALRTNHNSKRISKSRTSNLIESLVEYTKNGGIYSVIRGSQRVLCGAENGEVVILCDRPDLMSLALNLPGKETKSFRASLESPASIRDIFVLEASVGWFPEQLEKSMIKNRVSSELGNLKYYKVNPIFELNALLYWSFGRDDTMLSLDESIRSVMSSWLRSQMGQFSEPTDAANLVCMTGKPW